MRARLSDLGRKSMQEAGVQMLAVAISGGNSMPVTGNWHAAPTPPDKVHALEGDFISAISRHCLQLADTFLSASRSSDIGTVF